jgi:hypothetical protein
MWSDHASARRAAIFIKTMYQRCRGGGTGILFQSCGPQDHGVRTKYSYSAVAALEL